MRTFLFIAFYLTVFISRGQTKNDSLLKAFGIKTIKWRTEHTSSSTIPSCNIMHIDINGLPYKQIHYATPIDTAYPFDIDTIFTYTTYDSLKRINSEKIYRKDYALIRIYTYFNDNEYLVHTDIQNTSVTPAIKEKYTRRIQIESKKTPDKDVIKIYVDKKLSSATNYIKLNEEQWSFNTKDELGSTVGKEYRNTNGNIIKTEYERTQKHKGETKIFNVTREYFYNENRFMIKEIDHFKTETTTYYYEYLTE